MQALPLPCTFIYKAYGAAVSVPVSPCVFGDLSGPFYAAAKTLLPKHLHKTSGCCAACALHPLVFLAFPHGPASQYSQAGAAVLQADTLTRRLRCSSRAALPYTHPRKFSGTHLRYIPISIHNPVPAAASGLCRGRTPAWKLYPAALWLLFRGHTAPMWAGPLPKARRFWQSSPMPC